MSALQDAEEYDKFVAQISEMWNTQPNYTPEQLATSRRRS